MVELLRHRQKKEAETDMFSLKPPRAALVKSHGGERCGNVGTMIPAGTVESGERKRTVDEVSKAD